MTVEDWAEIRRLHAREQMSIRAIAKRLGSLATRCRGRWPRSGHRRMNGRRWSLVSMTTSRGFGVVEGFPDDAGHRDRPAVSWDGSPLWFRKQVAKVRVDYAPRDPAGWIEYDLGDQAQCDLWFPPVKIPLGPHSTPARRSWRAGSCSCARSTRNRRGSWNARTATSKPRCCPVARSPAPPTSTLSWRRGCCPHAQGVRHVAGHSGSCRDTTSRSGPSRLHGAPANSFAPVGRHDLTSKIRPSG